MQRAALRILPLFAMVTTFDACTSSDAQSPTPKPDAGGRFAAGPFDGHCSSTRWSDVSDDCWSCICGACADTLNKCNGDCLNLLWCAVDKHALVNVAADLACEVRATLASCAGEPNAGAEFGNVTAFDTCLVVKPKPDGGGFRACERECDITYTGDVCTRYPGADGG